MFKLEKEQGDKEEVKYEENSLKHCSLAFIFSFDSVYLVPVGFSSL